MGYILSGEASQIVFRIEKKDKERFERYARKNSEKVPNLLRDFVKKYIEENKR